MFEYNYEVRCGINNKSMNQMFLKTPLSIIKALSIKKIPETYEINWCWMVCGKIAQGLTPLRRSKLSKQSQDKED